MISTDQRLRAKVKAVENCKASLKRKQEELVLICKTRRRELAGEVMLWLIETGRSVSDPLAVMDAALTNAQDRDLFGLPPQAVADPVDPADMEK